MIEFRVFASDGKTQLGTIQIEATEGSKVAPVTYSGKAVEVLRRAIASQPGKRGKRIKAEKASGSDIWVALLKLRQTANIKFQVSQGLDILKADKDKPGVIH